MVNALETSPGRGVGCPTASLPGETPKFLSSAKAVPVGPLRLSTRAWGTPSQLCHGLLPKIPHKDALSVDADVLQDVGLKGQEDLGSGADLGESCTRWIWSF